MNARYISLFYLALACFAVINCSDDDEEQEILKDIEGTVLGTVSCSTQNNGLAYEIDVENLDSIDKIIVSNLPDEFKTDGIKLRFDMQKSTDGFTVCVALYSPDIFFKLKNIRSIGN